MFIAHLPAGYLLARAIGPRAVAVLPVALAASVLPDLDLLWFYGPGGRRVPHHAYVTHMPLFWTFACALLWLVLRAWKFPRAGLLAAVALASLLLHLVLDTVAGGIRWLWPFSDREFVLIHVPRAYDGWLWNFVLHPSFLLELAIVVAALVAWLRRRA